MLFGTVTIAVIAMCVSVPLALGTALLIAEVLRGRLKQWAITLVDLMAAVPSVVFGLWGVFFLQESDHPGLAVDLDVLRLDPVLRGDRSDGNALTDASASPRRPSSPASSSR